jgi:hypothetical protein
MKVVVDLAAQADLDSARRFYDAQQTGIGDECVDHLLTCLDGLFITAGIHFCSRSVYPRLLQEHFPHFGIFYSIQKDLIIIRANLDLRRNTKTRQRLPGRRFP